ncbi:hypothetical protein CPB85DRAFT_1235691, partial [Mucidula mucida]
AGKACFACETTAPRHHTGGIIYCPFCTKTPIPLDLSKPPSVLNHIGAHLLNKSLDGERCGLCGSLAPQCSFYLTKGPNPQVDRDQTTGCVVFDLLETCGFRYAAAAESKPNNPCSNVPIPCQICVRNNISKKAPAIWKYNAREHYQKKHANVDLRLYEADWTRTSAEKKAMKDKYTERYKRSKLAMFRSKEKVRQDVGELVISAAHSTCHAER